MEARGFIHVSFTPVSIYGSIGMNARYFRNPSSAAIETPLYKNPYTKSPPNKESLFHKKLY